MSLTSFACSKNKPINLGNIGVIMNRYIFLLLIIFCSTPVYAYIDPSSGSAIVAAIVGFFAAIIWNIKKIWYKLKRLFFKKNN